MLSDGYHHIYHYHNGYHRNTYHHKCYKHDILKMFNIFIYISFFVTIGGNIFGEFISD